MQIHLDATQGNLTGVAHQIAQGVEVNCLDEDTSQTPLMCAVASDDAGIDLLQFLISNGADINAATGEFQTNPLTLAVHSGNLEKIQFLLDAGANLHYQRPDNYDVLIDAVHGRDIAQDENLIPILALLIQRGANLCGVSHYGESALKTVSRIGRFDAVKLLLAAGADATQLKWTELMSAIAFRQIEAVQSLLHQGADLAARDVWGRTPWLLSLQMGDLELAKLLLASGANQDEVGHCGKTPLMYAIESGNLECFEWLIAAGCDLEATDEFGSTPLMIAAAFHAVDQVRLLLQKGANPARTDNCNTKAIAITSNLEIVKMLVAAGEDLSDINDDVRSLLTGVGKQALQVTREQYLTGRYRRFGQANPERMDIDFWQAMIRCGDTAYGARNRFNDTDESQPVWCYQRFGRTITELPDGRIVEIAGEHEDYYDPDFCIYNDVVVYQGDGHFQIFSYPRDVFPPTDFHSATLVGQHIYIIGSLGYWNERIDHETPVYRLDCDTFKIERLETMGDKPGWISDHKAYYKEPGQIYVTGGKVNTMIDDRMEYTDNLVNYCLDLVSFSWCRLE